MASELGLPLRCSLLIPTPAGDVPWASIPPNLDNEDVFINLTDDGIRLSFPRDTDRTVSTWYGPELHSKESDVYHITIELPPSGFQVDIRPLISEDTQSLQIAATGKESPNLQIVTITLDEKCSAEVIGFGTPFHGANSAVHRWVNHDTPICGVASLCHILQSNKFVLLVPASKDLCQQIVDSFSTSKKPEPYGYGKIHTWDMNRYSQQIPINRGPFFIPRIRFENANERDTALTQCHVQDIWDFKNILNEIAEMEVPGLIWKLGDDLDGKRVQFACLLEPSKEFDHRHWRAAHRALEPGTSCKLQVSFKSSEGTVWEACSRYTEAIGYLERLEYKGRLPLLLTRPEESQPNQEFYPTIHSCFSETDDKSERNTMTLRCHLNLDLQKRRVLAINRLRSGIIPSVMEADSQAFIKKVIFNELLIGKGLWSLQKPGGNVQIPTLDLFDGVPTEIQNACIAHVSRRDKERVQQYFGKLYLGLGLVPSTYKSGKTYLASILAILMCFNKSIQRVYVTTLFQVKTDDIFDRMVGLAQKITGNLQGNYKHLMLVRGYSLNTEVDNCIKALLGKPLRKPSIWNPSPWRFERSLCWWTLRALGSNVVPPLTVDDNTEIWELHQNLNDAVASPSGKPHLSKFVQLVKLAQGSESHTSMDYREALGELMEFVVACANIVAATSSDSYSKAYQSFNNSKARAMVFDEAHAMYSSDALMLYGNTPRPMIAFGLKEGWAAPLRTYSEKLYGDDTSHSKFIATNRFSQFVHISWLCWFIHLGWPVFQLYNKYRSYYSHTPYEALVYKRSLPEPAQNYYRLQPWTPDRGVSAGREPGHSGHNSQ